jgi:hypothetical protein
MLASGFGDARVFLHYKDRPHLSKSAIDRHGNVDYLAAGYSYENGYVEGVTKRYVAAVNLVEDLIFTVYEVNSSRIIVSRVNSDIAVVEAKVKGFIERFRKPNIEARLIGGQNTERTLNISELMRIIEAYKLPLFEIDLFGNEVRHVAMDIKLGTSNNILIENRINRPGELINQPGAKNPLEQPPFGLSDTTILGNRGPYR